MGNFIAAIFKWAIVLASLGGIVEATLKLADLSAQSSLVSLSILNKQLTRSSPNSTNQKKGNIEGMKAGLEDTHRLKSR